MLRLNTDKKKRNRRRTAAKGDKIGLDAHPHPCTLCCVKLFYTIFMFHVCDSDGEFSSNPSRYRNCTGKTEKGEKDLIWLYSNKKISRFTISIRHFNNNKITPGFSYTYIHHSYIQVYIQYIIFVLCIWNVMNVHTCILRYVLYREENGWMLTGWCGSYGCLPKERKQKIMVNAFGAGVVRRPHHHHDHRQGR